ncbi:MAG: hypothetical protein WAL78_14085 [Candidatus Acidiferrales bacterium]
MIHYMHDVNIHIDSSTNTASKTLAPKTLLSALRDFANTGDEPKQIANFLQRWPDFLDRNKVESDVPLSMRDVIVRPFFPSTKGPLYRMFKMLRGSVRHAWKGNEDMLARLLSTNFEPALNNFIVVDWRHGGFRYEPQTPFQAAVYELLKHSGSARVCANPDCPSPYFIAQDHRAKFCSEDCVQTMQRTWRKKWWNQHGKQWRKRRAAQSTKRRKEQ